MTKLQLPNIPFVVLDTETTGFIPKVNRVIEYAHTLYRDGKQEDECEELISIPDDIPGIVQIITRIRPEALHGKPTFEMLRETLKKRIGQDTLIVGQNILFDIRMLKGEGIDLSDRPWIDTSMLASLVFPELESYSLGFISAVLNLHHEPVHRALGDVRATTELLGICWERLLELPQDMAADLKATMHKNGDGYKMLFDALPEAKGKGRPQWMTMPEAEKLQSTKDKVQIRKPEIGTVDLIEEPLHPGFLQGIINATAADTSTVHWIAVKNLTAMAKRLHLSAEVRVLQPPFLLLDEAAADTLAAQDAYSPDEATLLTKLDWYKPSVFSDAPIHGEEKSIWDGRLACTDQSPSYTAQFTDLPSVILLDHRQLLAFVADPDHAAHGVLQTDAHIIIDDASMLEDTASKAYGYYCGIGNLRAAAVEHASVMRFTDLLQLWIEKTRNEQDVRFLAPSDLTSPDACALRDQIPALLTDDSLPIQTQQQLTAVLHCLEEEASVRITWIETRQDGSQFLHSVPESVAELLKKDLYDKYPVSLLIPPLSADLLQETLHRSTQTTVNDTIARTQDPISVSFPEALGSVKVLGDPPDGKTVILASSRRVIEDYFIRFTEDLEARGISLFCQGLSGGQRRMQAEFLAAQAPAIWVLTPWMFEGIELPPGTVDHLIIDALPFDHPAQPVFGKRAEHFNNAFLGYSMPRLLHRLFRILRTFRRVASDTADITVIDNRIREKKYGKHIRQYLELCCEAQPKQANVKEGKSNKDYPENWQMNLF